MLDGSPHLSQEKEAPANCIENVYVDVLDESNAEEQEVEVIECSIRTYVQHHSTRRHNYHIENAVIDFQMILVTRKVIEKNSEYFIIELVESN